jgi:hypothetical protein
MIIARSGVELDNATFNIGGVVQGSTTPVNCPTIPDTMPA